MIKDSQELEKFEKELIKKERIDIIRNFRLADALYNEAVSLGVFPLSDPLEGLEIDIKIAKVVNSVSKDTKDMEIFWINSL